MFVIQDTIRKYILNSLISFLGTKARYRTFWLYYKHYIAPDELGSSPWHFMTNKTCLSKVPLDTVHCFCCSTWIQLFPPPALKCNYIITIATWWQCYSDNIYSCIIFISLWILIKGNGPNMNSFEVKREEEYIMSMSYIRSIATKNKTRFEISQKCCCPLGKSKQQLKPSSD